MDPDQMFSLYHSRENCLTCAAIAFLLCFDGCGREEEDLDELLQPYYPHCASWLDP